MSAGRPRPLPGRPLTERQREVVRLRALGLTATAIAARMKIRPSTVNSIAKYLRITRGDHVAPRRETAVAPTRLTRRDVLACCREHGGATVNDIAAEYGAKRAAAAKQLQRLRVAGLVECRPLYAQRIGEGTPPYVWTLTPKGAAELRRLEAT